jgi:predicted alpha/beta hydrolase family esterase
MITDAKRWKALKASNYRAACLPKRPRPRWEAAREYDLLSRAANRFCTMKRFPVLVAFCSLSCLVAAPATEAPPAIREQVEQVLAVAKAVQAQQAAIAENQAKIDAKLATIAESVRVARLYGSRSGGK